MSESNKNEKYLFEVLHRLAVQEILLELYEEPMNASEISETLNKNYSQVHRTLNLLEENQLVESVKEGNKKKYSLLKKGKKISKLLTDFKSTLKDNFSNYLKENQEEIHDIGIDSITRLNKFFSFLLSASGNTLSMEEFHSEIEGDELYKEILKSDVTPTIKVIGVGGAGGNIITTLNDMLSEEADTAVIHTDKSHLAEVNSDEKLLIGENIAGGMGAGGKPPIGKECAEKSKGEIKNLVKNNDITILTCGLGGGTGTGATPIISKLAKKSGSFIIAVVTLPFKMEGTRIEKAREGLEELREVADSIVVMENQRLLDERGDMPVKQAFAVADEHLASFIKGITGLLINPSLVNVDLNDLKTVFKSEKIGTFGVGEAEGKNRAEKALDRSLSNILLDTNPLKAKSAFIEIIGGHAINLDEINKIGGALSKKLDPSAQVVWGATVKPDYAGKLRVFTFLNGFEVAGRWEEIPEEEIEARDKHDG